VIIRNLKPDIYQTIVADWGDILEITVTSHLTANGTGIHWHGMRQLGTNQMDGVNGITECPIAPGETRLYRFQATQYGTTVGLLKVTFMKILTISVVSLALLSSIWRRSLGNYHYQWAIHCQLRYRPWHASYHGLVSCNHFHSKCCVPARKWSSNC
jgi:hypothetical protein